ncbi:hypothetical protein F503_07021 [Ophiostoma piceae UAMH 11346]|uniref:Secreted protein n=1 Tax=Ophiostoma piceae (strain UAMH 11346) TaxID=1262450 RepID=S3D783_OPHP1|nr:hypothetical protein F503_07021 [Ophiostoma piceae UAMH 11346]
MHWLHTRVDFCIAFLHSLFLQSCTCTTCTIYRGRGSPWCGVVCSNTRSAETAAAVAEGNLAWWPGLLDAPPRWRWEQCTSPGLTL